MKNSLLSMADIFFQENGESPADFEKIMACPWEKCRINYRVTRKFKIREKVCENLYISPNFL